MSTITNASACGSPGQSPSPAPAGRLGNHRRKRLRVTWAITDASACGSHGQSPTPAPAGRLGTRICLSLFIRKHHMANNPGCLRVPEKRSALVDIPPRGDGLVCHGVRVLTQDGQECYTDSFRNDGSKAIAQLGCYARKALEAAMVWLLEVSR
jgi:hypothetical protein